MFKLNITTKLVLLFLLIGILPMMVVGLSNYNKMDKSHDHLTRETMQSVLYFKKNLVEEYFGEVKSDLEVLAVTSEVRLLIDVLHDHFAAEGDKETLDTDSDIFKTVLNRYASSITFMGDKFGFSDIYVICKNHGHIMYSANRGPELGQNLRTGKLRQSGLGRAWRRSMTENRVVLEDYSYYGADTGLPQAFAAAPIRNENGDNIGAIAIAIPLDYINNLLKDTAALGESGETYLVGDDFLMRSESRLDKESSILHREVRTDLVVRAMEGVRECSASLDYRNTRVLACSGKLSISDFDWVIVAKIDHAEVDAFADELWANLFILFGIFGAVTLVSAVVFSMLFVGPIRKLAEATRVVAKGDLRPRVAVHRKDELGDLANSFNEMADGMRDIVSQAEKIAEGDFNVVAIEPRSEHDQLGLTLQKMTQNLSNYARKVENTAWQQTGRAQLAEITQGEVALDPLSHKVITYMSKYIGAQIAAMYLLDEDNKLRLSGNYAFTHRKNLSQKFEIGESLVGQTALEKNRIILENVPEDYAAVQSALGESPPKNIVLQPVLYEGELLGVIEFGSLYPFTKDTLDFLDTATEAIGTAIHNAIGHSKLNMLLETSQQQAEELEVQQEELRQTNQELEEHARTLKENEDQLKIQQEMLETTNTELEERTEALQQQKYEILKQNEEVESARQMLVIKAKEVEETSKYKSEFLANMSHELRTPLNSLLILSSLLVENKDQNLSTKQQEFARTINSSGQELLELINEILDLSKIEAGKIELNLESFNVERMLNDIRAKLGPLAENKGLEFNVDIASSIPEQICSDSQRVGQILRNLISNALKFTENGQVKLAAAPPSDEVLEYLGFSTKKRDQYLAFSIEDTGIGIAQDKQQLIFEAFQQADGTTQRRYGGTGLGLSISRELARLLGGGIYLESEEGKGSIFTVVIEVEKSTGKLGKEQETVPSDGLGVDLKSETVYAPASRAGFTDAGNGNGDVFETNNDVLSAMPLPKQVKSVENIRDDRREIEKNDRSLLIIEDDEEFTRMLIELSREQGFKVLLAHDGASALHLADYYQPNGILLDIGLPGGMDGITVLTKIKENLRTRHIPVHVISGHERRAEAMRIGAVGFLQKPVNVTQLQGAFSRLQSVISRKVKRLLLVEDNENESKSLRAMLDDAQLDIVSAFSGREALEMLKKESFDCIVLDLGLPDMSGIEMLKKMRLDESDVHIPVIIFTGKELSSTERRELDKYAERVLVKGVRSPERLLDETALFLHTVEKELPEQKRTILRMLHDKEAIFDGRKILIVDDDMRNVFAISSILEEKGLELLVAGDGQECIDILNANPDVHLVLMDIMMPVMDGYEAMKQIRTYAEFKNLPIIALTAKAMKGDRAKCIEAGASDYLAKPVDTDKLLSMLRVWLYQ